PSWHAVGDSSFYFCIRAHGLAAWVHHRPGDAEGLRGQHRGGDHLRVGARGVRGHLRG
ncbi:unnamed protein product, partial [Heterosigma akashiwo]